MSKATLLRAIRIELQKVAKNPKLRNKDIMEWSTGKVKPQEGEVVYHLPDIGVYVAIEEEAKGDGTV